MNSLLHRAVKKTYDKVSQWNETLNGPDPRFVSYRENGKDKKIDNLDLNAEHCHSFIGKMKVDGSGTYSNEVITALLKYFFDHTKKGEKVVIELANKVSEILNGEESMEGNRDYKDQKDHMLDLARGLNKKRLGDLEIVDIEDNNKRLFEVLKNEGIKGLELDGLKTALGENFDSLDIARILYYVAKNDPKYLEEIKGLKSEELRQMNGNSDYYGLIEMAIRINALLHGITLQGGVARQKKYDTLLLKHINRYIEEFPLLKNFREFCREKLKGESFKGLYFDTEGSEKLINKLDAKKRLVSKTKNNLLIGLGVATGVGGTILGNNYIQSKRQEKAIQETIKEIFENKKLIRSGDYGWGEYTGKEKLEKINEYIQKIYDRFIFRYGSDGRKFDEKKLRSAIISCLNNQHLLAALGSAYGYDDVALADVIIDEYLLPQNVGEFGVNIKPYPSLIPYTDEFINTVLLEDDFEIKADSINKTLDAKRGVPVFHFPAVNDIGGFSSKKLPRKSGFSFFKDRFGIVSHNGKRYVVASTHGYVDKFDEKECGPFSTGEARYLAIDFLEQTNPVLDLLLDQYLIRYHKWEGNSFDANGNREKTKIDGHTELFLIRGFLKKGLLKEIGGDVNESNRNDKIKKINEFLDVFVAKNKTRFKELSEGTNPTLKPNGFFSEYEDAMENVIKYGDKMDRSPVTDRGKNNTVNHLGVYQSSDFKLYDVGFVQIGSRRYLYADEKGRPDYGSKTYGPSEGADVAIDYMKQANPVIKQLLEIFSLRYFGGNNPIDIDNYPYSSNYVFDVYSAMQNKIVIDFVSRGMLRMEGKGITDKIKSELVTYIDNFINQEKTEFVRLSGYDDNKINKEMIPNYFLHHYERFMRNSIDYKNKENDKILIGPSIEKISNKIGSYYSSDGEEYIVWTSYIGLIPYFCAEKVGEPDNDVVGCGAKVAKDYFQAKTRYWQNKILNDKKNKSASQKHVDPSIKNR